MERNKRCGFGGFISPVKHIEINGCVMVAQKWYEGPEGGLGAPAEVLGVHQLKFVW